MDIHEARATVEDILDTPALYRRQARECRLDSELAAYRELSALMAVDPQLAIQRFLELALELCPGAGSSGLSELTEDETGAPIFRWTALAGAFANYVGGATPRDFSPCGLCLDHHHAILVDRPARVFSYFDEAEPPIVEGLIVPLYDTGKRPLGTLWVVSHDAANRFDPTDVRILEQLAVQLVLAIKLRRKARILAEMEQLVRDKDLLVQEVNHRVKNTIQMTSALLHLQQRGASQEARHALKEAQSRLLVLANVYEALLNPGVEGDLASIDMHKLLDRLLNALSASSQHAGLVELRSVCDGVHLDASQAVAVGLVVNEAVTNALKHGFPRGRSGEVVIDLSRSGNVYSLKIQDNGTGFKQARRDGSLGVRLMESLARQLGAKLDMNGSSGTTLMLQWQAPRTVRAQTGGMRPTELEVSR